MTDNYLKVLDSLNESNRTLTEEAAAARKDLLEARKLIDSLQKESAELHQAIAYLCITGQIFNYREWSERCKMNKKEYLQIISGFASLL